MENEQKKIAAYIYDLEPAEGNAQQEIPLTLLAKRILETATYHAENWGVGYSTLIKENRAWVLARLAIEMSSYPGIYDKYKIETWIEGYNKHFSARNFCFSNPDGEIYGYARSIWSVIDIQSRTSVDITTFRHIENNVGDKDCPIAPQSKIKPVNEERSIKAREIGTKRIKRNPLQTSGFAVVCHYSQTAGKGRIMQGFRYQVITCSATCK